MKIYIGADHAGFELKKRIIEFLQKQGHEVFDQGAFSFDPNDDYPDFIAPVARAVSRDENARGIVLGGSGQGEAMLANRFSRVRTTLYYGGPCEMVALSRDHNDSNVLSLGARFLTESEALRAVKMWLQAPFSESERHKRRINKIEDESLKK